MWRFRFMVILVVLTAGVMYGTTVAQGAWYWNAWYWNAWYWNANGSSQGVDFRTAWTVVDSATGESIDGDELNYHTDIRITVPEGSDFTLVEQAETESVSVRTDDDLECTDDGIEVEVSYRVKPLRGAMGDEVNVWVTADGDLLGEKAGRLRKKIKLEVFIPAPEGVTPTCYDDDRD